MTPHEEQKVIQWNKGLSRNIELKVNLTEDRRSEQFRNFCTDMAVFASKVEIAETRPQNEVLPSIEISDNLRYFAIPTGPGLVTFLDAVMLCAEGFALIPKAIREKTERVESPARLRLHISQQCPHCPASVRDLAPLTVVNEFISLDIIDGALFPELSQAADIDCVPTVLFSDSFRWTGVTAAEEIVEVLADQYSATLSIAAIERMLQEKNASRLVEMMLEAGEVFPSFVRLLADEKFTVRLGAMVVMEMLVEQNMRLASQVIWPLWERFEEMVEPVQIDVLYVFGDVGTKETVPLLEFVIKDHHRDHLKEVASESIQRINDRNSMV